LPAELAELPFGLVDLVREEFQRRRSRW